MGTTHDVLIYPPNHFEFGISDTYTNFTHTTYLLTGHYRCTRKWTKQCLWSSSFLLGSEFLTNENGVQMVLCFLLCYTFKFSYCYLIHQLGGKKKRLAKKPPWKWIGINQKSFCPLLKRNSIYVKGKKKKKHNTKQTRIAALQSVFKLQKMLSIVAKWGSDKKSIRCICCID